MPFGRKPAADSPHAAGGESAHAAEHAGNEGACTAERAGASTATPAPASTKSRARQVLTVSFILANVLFLALLARRATS